MKREEIAELVRQYDRLHESGRKEEAEAMLRMYPSLLDYDVYGNFVGRLSNENGWTP